MVRADRRTVGQHLKNRLSISASKMIVRMKTENVACMPAIGNSSVSKRLTKTAISQQFGKHGLYFSILKMREACQNGENWPTHFGVRETGWNEMYWKTLIPFAFSDGACTD